MSTNLNQPNQCPSCGQPMPAGALAGLCPVCLLAQGVETETADTKARVRFEPPKLAEISRLFPQLEVLELLGAGGMGAVYKARQPALDRLVALKVLPAGGGVGSTERFNREARALARLSHPNIVGVHEFGQVEGLHFFIMEFVDGANLRQLEKTSRLSPRGALQIIPQICDALQYAHDEGVVHRDIKPENVLVDRKGRVKIADFGLAKIVDPDPAAARLTVEGQVMGTPHYMAPEQVERPLAVDHRADIYALGVVFYEMLTGDLPLGKFAPPSRKVQVDVRLDDIVLRALENDPERRYQQASEVKSQVETITRGPDSSPAGKVTDEAGRPGGTGGEMEVTSERCSGWLGVALRARLADRLQIRWGGALALFGLMLGLLTLLFAFVSALGLGTAGGLVGLAGWLSVTARVALALGLTALGLWLSGLPGAQSELIPRKSVILPSARKAWRRTGTGVVVALMALAWLYFQAHWLVPWFKGKLDNNAQVARINPVTRTLAATLANGTTIELLGLAPGDGEPNQWWRPDGTPVSNAVIDIQGPAEMLGNDRPRTKFAFKVTGSTWAMETASYEFEPSAGISAGGEVWQNGKKIDGGWPMVAAWSHVTNRATLRLGLRFDTWRNVAVFTPNEPKRTETSTMSGDPKWIAKLNHYSDDGSNTLVTAVLNRETKDWRMRVVAVDKDGQEHFYHRANVTPAETSETWSCTFPNLTVDRIEKFQVQVQPVHWVEFRNVPLSSNGRLAEAAKPTKADHRQADLAYGPASETHLEELPELRFLAWQDHWQSNRATAVHLPDGTKVNFSDVKDLLQRLQPQHAGFSQGGHASPPRFLHLWLSHPAFDRHSVVGLSLRDREGTPLPLGAGGMRLQGREVIETPEGRTGWLMMTLCPSDDPTPGEIELQLDYAIGPIRTLNTVAPDFRGGMAFLNGSQLSAVGSNADGSAFIALALSAIDRESRQFGVTVAAKSGQELTPSGLNLNTASSGGLSTARYEFDLPLDQVKEFKIGTRPVRSATWKGVVLPNGHLPEVPDQSDGLTFGPVREISFDELLDLDTGRTGEFPADHRPRQNSNSAATLFNGLAESIAWMRDQGYNAEARTGAIGLLAVRTVQLQPEDWDSMKPTELIERLERDGSLVETRGAAARVPDTLGFQTLKPNGTVGMIEVLGYEKDRPGATVRYKLVDMPRFPLPPVVP